MAIATTQEILPTQVMWPVRNSIDEREKKAVMDLVNECIETGHPIGYSGKREEAYASAFAEFLGGGYADAVNSGSNALYTALRALNLDPFHEVIVPPVTDAGGVMSIPLNLLIPVPADTEPGSYNMGAEQIRHRITPLTRAIVVAHIAGLPANMTEIAKVAREHGLYLIEDCSQSHGALHNGQHVGTFGDIAIFSMMHSKHHCMGGQGGMVFTKNEELWWKIRRASDRGKPFGMDEKNGNVIATLNCNTDELSCAIGLAQLRKLPDILARRRHSAGRIAEECKSLQSVRMVEARTGDTGSFWFILFKLEQEKMRVSKREFVEWMCKGGIPFWHTYDIQPCKSTWYVERNVFGKSGYPWSAPDYKGDARASYHTPNLDKAINEHFMLYFNENVAEREIAAVMHTLKSAEEQFLR